MFKEKILPYLVFSLYWVWSRTWRITIIESPGLIEAKKNNKPMVFAFWHGDELLIISLSRFYKVATMTSTSQDGELLTKVVNLMGVKTSRGSSTRGGVSALKGLLRITKEGYTPVVAVDGPKGPLHVVKPGVFQLAQSLRALVVPLSYSASRSYIFKKSWNQAALPLPFSKVFVLWGEPFEISRETDPRDVGLAENLASRLNALGHEASKLIARV